MKLDKSCMHLLGWLTFEYHSCKSASDRAYYDECKSALQDVIRRLTNTDGHIVYDPISEMHYFTISNK